MKRTPPWVFVAAVGVQLAALGLCLWAMERILHAEEAEPAPAPAPPPPPEPPAAPVEALAPPPVVAEATVPAAAATPAPPAEPEPARRDADDRVAPVTVRAVSFGEIDHRFNDAPPHEPRIFEPEPRPPRVPEAEPFLGEPRPGPAVVRVQQPSPAAPAFGPPPARQQASIEAHGVPGYIGEIADATTQIVAGEAGGGRFAFGFYPDGNIRFVDVDGGRYAGKAESARARMREVDGTRAFTVQIGVAADGRLQASFSGGPHSAHTIALEPLLVGGATG